MLDCILVCECWDCWSEDGDVMLFVDTFSLLAELLHSTLLVLESVEWVETGG